MRRVLSGHELQSISKRQRFHLPRFGRADSRPPRALIFLYIMSAFSCNAHPNHSAKSGLHSSHLIQGGTIIIDGEEHKQHPMQ